jgi:hypothetical protein
VLDAAATGIIFRSVRDSAGECLACFRPALVRNVHAGGHYELRWHGRQAVGSDSTDSTLSTLSSV